MSVKSRLKLRLLLIKLVLDQPGHYTKIGLKINTKQLTKRNSSDKELGSGNGGYKTLTNALVGLRCRFRAAAITWDLNVFKLLRAIHICDRSWDGTSSRLAIGCNNRLTSAEPEMCFFSDSPT